MRFLSLSLLRQHQQRPSLNCSRRRTIIPTTSRSNNRSFAASTTTNCSNDPSSSFHRLQSAPTVVVKESSSQHFFFKLQQDHQQLHDEKKRLFSSSKTTTTSESVTPTSNDKNKNDNHNNTTSMSDHRNSLIRASLEQVHTLGWTQDAIMAAIVQSQSTSSTTTSFPISMIGLVTPSDLISYCMEEWNHQLEIFLVQQQQQQMQMMPMQQYYQKAIQFRLSLVVPYIQSGQWHTAMAMGATQNTIMTHNQVHRIVELMTRSNRAASSSSLPSSSLALHQAAIGAIYIATELHLLTDTSTNYEETWKFLNQRLTDYEQLSSMGGGSAAGGSVGGAAVAEVAGNTIQAGVQSMGQLLSSIATSTGPAGFATTAVVSSLLDGAASVLLPQGGGDQQQQPWTTATTSTTMGTTTSNSSTRDNSSSSSSSASFGTNPNDYAPPPMSNK